MCIVCNSGFQAAFQTLSLGDSWRKSRRGFLKIAAAVSAASFVAQAISPAHADGSINEPLTEGFGAPSLAASATTTIYTARKIITMERGAAEATAVAVAGKRIVSAGTLDQVKAVLGRQSFIVDETFKDKIVLPGLIDQHLHPILGALTLAVAVIAPEDWVLPGVTHKAAETPDAYWARLTTVEAQLTDPREWMITWGFQQLWHGPLSRAALDRLSATRPIAVWHRSCHEFYLNSAALTTLGITEAMTLGKGQYSEQANWREGHFWEGGLNLMIAPMLKVLASPSRLTFGLKQMIAYLHSNGVTAYMEPGALYTPDIWKLYEQILAAPETPMYSTFIADGRGIIDRVGIDRALDATEAQIAVAPESPDKKLMFLPGQVKLFADGAIISQLMQMKDGYLDGHKGEWILEPSELERRARLYWNAGYQIHTHVNGDLGLEVLIGILEKLNSEHPRNDHRCVIVHFANSTEEQVARIGKLGAIVSANPYYTSGFADKYSQVGLGPERADMMVRAKSAIDRGIPLSYHSDLPMAPSAPLFLAWCGVNRLTPSNRVAGPSQCVSVDAALRAITIEAAYSWRKENQIGSIAPGKIANLTVLEQDPYAVAPTALKDIAVWGTMFEGKVYPVVRKT